MEQCVSQVLLKIIRQLAGNKWSLIIGMIPTEADSFTEKSGKKIFIEQQLKSLLSHNACTVKLYFFAPVFFSLILKAIV